VTQPFPAIFQSPYQLYIDGYRTLGSASGRKVTLDGWADDEFVKQYGDTYFPLVQSESKNNAGLGSSQEAVDGSNRYKSLISKYGVEAGQAKPNLIRLIVGQEGEGDFNASAHQWQETREISPASGLKYRTYDNPQEAQANADADLGWLKYRQFMSNLDAMALEQGFRTYADSDELTRLGKSSSRTSRPRTRRGTSTGPSGTTTRSPGTCKPWVRSRAPGSSVRCGPT
jgi:hypothetical protein